jgi:hypothetical protein
MLHAIEEGAVWYATRATILAHLKAGRVIYWRGKYRLTDMGRASGAPSMQITRTHAHHLTITGAAHVVGTLGPFHLLNTGEYFA